MPLCLCSSATHCEALDASCAALCMQLEGLKDTLTPHGAWRPNYATHMRASAMHQLRSEGHRPSDPVRTVRSCASLWSRLRWGCKRHAGVTSWP